MGLISTSSCGTEESIRFVISTGSISSKMSEALEKINLDYEGKIWKGFLFHERDCCYWLYVRRSDIYGGENLVEGKTYCFEITGADDFGRNLCWKEPEKYEWRFGMNIRMKTVGMY